MLSNVYFLAKFGFDTAENEVCKVCPHSAYRSPKWPGSFGCAKAAPALQKKIKKDKKKDKKKAEAKSSLSSEASCQRVQQQYVRLVVLGLVEVETSWGLHMPTLVVPHSRIFGKILQDFWKRPAVEENYQMSSNRSAKHSAKIAHTPSR